MEKELKDIPTFFGADWAVIYVYSREFNDKVIKSLEKIHDKEKKDFFNDKNLQLSDEQLIKIRETWECFFQEKLNIDVQFEIQRVSAILRNEIVPEPPSKIKSILVTIVGIILLAICIWLLYPIELKIGDCVQIKAGDNVGRINNYGTEKDTFLIGFPPSMEMTYEHKSDLERVECPPQTLKIGDCVQIKAGDNVGRINNYGTEKDTFLIGFPRSMEMTYEYKSDLKRVECPKY
ncbi:hypothetical protein QUF90_11295 [Desulfococcaceae bacterium HSG9]|nr:hypothetical protein [Desulfococcaceae bacterium HSG9]